MGDAANNVGVIIAASVIWKTHSPARFYADPAVSVAIAFMIFLSSIPLCTFAFTGLSPPANHLHSQEDRPYSSRKRALRLAAQRRQARYRTGKLSPSTTTTTTTTIDCLGGMINERAGSWRRRCPRTTRLASESAQNPRLSPHHRSQDRAEGLHGPRTDSQRVPPRLRHSLFHPAA